MLLTLMLSLSLGQVTYEWIDSKGESHFTDDVSTIPSKAKRRVIQGAEPVVVVPRADAGVAAAPAPVVAPAPRPATGPDSCELAQRKLQDVEQQVEREKADFAQQQAREDQRCREVLNVSGHGGFAQCMAARPQSPPASTAAPRLEEARDALRRAQVGGCR